MSKHKKMQIRKKDQRITPSSSQPEIVVHIQHVGFWAFFPPLVLWFFCWTEEPDHLSLLLNIWQHFKSLCRVFLYGSSHSPTVAHLGGFQKLFGDATERRRTSCSETFVPVRDYSAVLFSGSGIVQSRDSFPNLTFSTGFWSNHNPWKTVLIWNVHLPCVLASLGD